MRKRLEPEVLATCLTEHLADDIRTALNTTNQFVASYEVSAPTLLNLQAAQRSLQAAMSYASAAALIAAQEGI
jgi:hypothetical protein